MPVYGAGAVQGKRYGADPNNLLIAVLTPLLVANAVLWTLVAHRPFVGLLWLAMIWVSFRFLGKP